MKRSLNKPVAFTLAALLATAVALPAEAGVVFDLNYNFGMVNAGGDVIVEITDGVDGNVSIAVTNNSAGFISDLFLNYNPSANLAGATIQTVDDGPFDVSHVAQPSVHFNALQGFAIKFGFQTANNNPDRFGTGEKVTFILDAAAELAAAGFNVLGGSPKGDDYYAAAHVIAVTATGTCIAGSAKIGDIDGGTVAERGNVADCSGLVRGNSVPAGVPEPATLALLALGLAGLGFSRREPVTRPGANASSGICVERGA